MSKEQYLLMLREYREKQERVFRECIGKYYDPTPDQSDSLPEPLVVEVPGTGKEG